MLITLFLLTTTAALIPLTQSFTMLTPRTPLDLQLEIKDPVDPTALTQSRAILDELLSVTKTTVSPQKLLEVAHRLNDIPTSTSPYVVTKEQCKEAFDSLSEDERGSLLRIHGRVKVFAEAQRKSVQDMEIDIPGGKAGHTVSPCRGKLLFGGSLLLVVCLYLNRMCKSCVIRDGLCQQRC